MRYILHLSYDGSAFCGWQIQNNAKSVQEELQKGLKTLLGEDISITGAGRTDTAVNAIGYVAHFDTAEAIRDLDEIRYKLNAIVPKKMVVHSIVATTDDFHARFGAKSREYHYFVHRFKDPFVENLSWLCHHDLDVEKMNEAARHLLGEHDFSCFEKTGGSNKTSICTVTYARWERYCPTHVSMMGYPATENDYLVFTVRANRFLRNMVRAIVGSLVEVGKGKQEPEWIEEVIRKGDRSMAGESVPGHALFFSGAEY